VLWPACRRGGSIDYAKILKRGTSSAALTVRQSRYERWIFSKRTMRLLLWPFAHLYAAVHCLLRHGTSPMEEWHHDRFVLRCPVCSRVFWHE
jgi:hypothetical protein